MTAEFGMLQFEKTLRAAPVRVFQALTDPADRMCWGAPDSGSVVIIEGQPAPAPGVREAARVGLRDTPYVDVTTDWIVMEAPTLLVYAETLSAEGALLGTSLATFELSALRAGTTLRVTVQLANFAGEGGVGELEAGWTHAMNTLADYV